MTDHIKTVTLTPAEQMREAAAQVADTCKIQNGPLADRYSNKDYQAGIATGAQAIAAAIRALPLPPEPAASSKVMKCH